jgi:hypothetical protein
MPEVEHLHQGCGMHIGMRFILENMGDASFVGPGSTRRLLRRLLTKPLVPRVLALR